MRRPDYWTEIALAVWVASNRSVDGHVGQMTPSAGAFGSPLAREGAEALHHRVRQVEAAGLVGRGVGDVREQRRAEVAEHERQVEPVGRTVDVVERRGLLVPVEAVVPDVALLRLQRPSTLSRLSRKKIWLSWSAFALKPVTGAVMGRYDGGIHCSIVVCGAALGL